MRTLLSVESVWIAVAGMITITYVAKVRVEHQHLFLEILTCFLGGISSLLSYQHKSFMNDESIFLH